MTRTDASERDALYRHVGLLTRQLHESLRELGHERQLEHAVGSLPDARDRLSYVSVLTGQAAEKVLEGVDRTKGELSRLAAGASALAAAVSDDPATGLDPQRVAAFLDEVGASTRRADEQLTEIMLAQGFHDLSGQVIGKVLALAQAMEAQLLRLLLVSGPAAGAPVTPAAVRADVMADQAQVDALLESLGF